MSRVVFPGPAAAVLLTLGSWFASSLVLGLFPQPLDVAAVGLAQTAGIGGVALLATRAVPPPHRERIGLRGFALRWLPLLLMLAPLSVLVSEIDNVVRLALPAPAAGAAAQAAERALDRLSGVGLYDVVERWVVVVGLTPVLEEWLFRGVIQQGLVARVGRAGGVAATAALFALGHVDLAGPPLAGLGSFASELLAGVAFGIARLGTGSILASMVAHGAMNALGLAALALAGRLPVPGFNAPGDHTPPVWLAGSAVLVAVAVWRTARAAARAPVSLPVPDAPDDTDEP